MKRLAIVLLTGLLALPAFGQQGPGGGGPGGQGGPGGPGGGGGFGGFNNGQPITPEMIQQFIQQAQQRQLDNIRQEMNCTDDEFAAIQPYLQKVMQLQTASQIGRVRFRLGGPNGGPNGRNGGNGPNGPNGAFGGQNIAALLNNINGPNDVQTATNELQAALDDQNSSAAVISAKLEALRAAKTRAAADLKAAQENLRQLLTQRQEGTLVWYGMLD